MRRDFLLLVRAYYEYNVSGRQLELHHGERAASDRLIKKGLMEQGPFSGVLLTKQGDELVEYLAKDLDSHIGALEHKRFLSE